MNELKPTPRRPSSWWAKQPIGNLFAGGVEGDFHDLSSESWLVALVNLSEMFAPMAGYPVIFPTATDCLL